jgi:flagellar basal-body rod protein FlgB
VTGRICVHENECWHVLPETNLSGVVSVEKFRSTTVARAVLGWLWQNMIDALFSSSNYQGLKKMLDATVMRHEAISSNLANLETPNYKRIDVNPSFASELNKAISAESTSQISSLSPKIVLDRNANSANRDGNTVQLDKELIALQENSMAHNMQTQFITGRFMKLKSAITGRNA